MRSKLARSATMCRRTGGLSKRCPGSAPLRLSGVRRSRIRRLRGPDAGRGGGCPVAHGLLVWAAQMGSRCGRPSSVRFPGRRVSLRTGKITGKKIFFAVALLTARKRSPQGSVSPGGETGTVGICPLRTDSGSPAGGFGRGVVGSPVAGADMKREDMKREDMKREDMDSLDGVAAVGRWRCFAGSGGLFAAARRLRGHEAVQNASIIGLFLYSSRALHHRPTESRAQHGVSKDACTARTRGHSFGLSFDNPSLRNP
jgi:hypothetical protein